MTLYFNNRIPCCNVIINVLYAVSLEQFVLFFSSLWLMEMQQDRPRPHWHRHRMLTHCDYLQFLHSLVMVGDRGLERLEELLLSLELVAHGPGPRVSGLGVLGLAVIRDGRSLGARGLDPKHSVLRIAFDLLLKLHFVHLQWKCVSDICSVSDWGQKNR